MKIILDTMDLVEVGLIVHERSLEAIKKYTALVNRKEKEYRKAMSIRGEVATYFKPITLKTNDITFHLIPSCNGKSDLKKYGPKVLITGEFIYKSQRFYSLLICKGSQVSLYTTHFLERYVERHLCDDSPISFDTFFKFLRETDGLSYGFVEGVDGRIQWSNSIGNSCGCVLHPKVLLKKTFIDKKTLVCGKKKEANDKGNVLMKYTTFDVFGNREIPKKITDNYNWVL